MISHKQFYERILQLICQYQMIDPGDHIVVGVSGGVDSIVLLTILHHLRDRLGIALSSAHLNHQFRGPEAERDVAFVRRFSEQLGIPCYVESCNVPEIAKHQKLSAQDAARQVRYRFFESVASQINAQKIATAHHADDQAETVLIGLLRGVGLHGLGGIQPILNHKIIRPLLTTTRAQIETFAQAAGVEYVCDSSNASRKYLRNAVRLDLLPFLKQRFNPAIVQRLTVYAQLFQEDAFFIDKIATEHYDQICEHVDGVVNVYLERFARIPVTLQRALIYKIFEALTGCRHRFETEHVRAVIELFTWKQTGKRLVLPGGVCARRSYTQGSIYLEAALIGRSSALPVTITVPGRSAFDGFCIDTEVLETSPPDGHRLKDMHPAHTLVQWMDYHRIMPPIRVRYRLPGDSFCPLGMQRKKTLKKFFIDRKIPDDTRKKIPLFEDQHGILWVAGHSIDERVKITANTQKILVCRVEKINEP